MKLTDKSPMPWGKYKGRLMEEVPDKYLDWLLGEMETTKKPKTESVRNVFDYIKENLRSIQSEL